MKKQLSLILALSLGLSTVSQPMADTATQSQEVPSEQPDKLSTFAQFRANLKSIATLPYHDAKALYNWAVKKYKKEPISETEQKRFEQARKRAGIAGVTTAVILGLAATVAGIKYAVDYINEPTKKENIRLLAEKEKKEKELEALKTQTSFFKSEIDKIFRSFDTAMDNGWYTQALELQNKYPNVKFPWNSYKKDIVFLIVIQNKIPGLKPFVMGMLDSISRDQLNQKFDNFIAPFVPLEHALSRLNYDKDIVRKLILRGANPFFRSSDPKYLTIYDKVWAENKDAQKVIDETLNSMGQRAFRVLNQRTSDRLPTTIQLPEEILQNIFSHIDQ